MRKSESPRLTELAKLLGIRITKFEEGNCTVELLVGAQHLNMAGVVHGGVHATLLDTSMGGTLVSIIEEEEWCATAQLDISYLNAVREGVCLIATSEVVRRGRHIAHVEGILDTADGTRVASAKGTWAIWEKRPQNRQG